MTGLLSGPAIAALILSLLHEEPMPRAILVDCVLRNMLDSGVVINDVDVVLRDLQADKFVTPSNGDCKLTARGQEVVDEALGKAGGTARLIAH